MEESRGVFLRPLREQRVVGGEDDFAPRVIVDFLDDLRRGLDRGAVGLAREAARRLGETGEGEGARRAEFQAALRQRGRRQRGRGEGGEHGAAVEFMRH